MATTALEPTHPAAEPVAETAPREGPREEIARRLVQAAAKRSFDPNTDITWPDRVEDDRFFIPEHRVSLYGTTMWDELSHGQRVALSRHEVASMAQAGIWFELILGQLLIRFAYDEDFTSQHVRWALTEIADECRHSSMFARLVATLEGQQHRPSARTIFLGRLMKTLADPVEGFADILIAEEILDTFQRETMVDESVQPLVRDVSRLHVIEEARHVKFARDELARRARRMSPFQLQRSRMIIAISARVVASALIQPTCYSAVGLDADEAQRVARHNPARRETLRWAASKLTAEFDELGLIGRGRARSVWVRAGLLAA